MAPVVTSSATQPTQHEHAPPASGATPMAIAPAAPATGRVALYAYKHGPATTAPGSPFPTPVLVDTSHGPTGDAIADRALATATRVDDYLRTRFHRNGVDGKGGPLVVAVHAPEAANAYWMTDEHRLEVGDGDDRMFAPLGDSPSVMAHEVYHGVIQSEVHLDYTKPQEAALHESFADVFAAGMTGTWKIGADVWTPHIPGDEIRDLEHPAIGNLRDVPNVKTAEAHALSGIPSLAAVRAAKAIGADALQDVWYQALTHHLGDHAGFSAAARATVAAARDLYGSTSAQADAVAQAWKSVGVLA